LFYDIDLPDKSAALWFFGQAGYYLKAQGHGILIDPYLSDSVGRSDVRFARQYPSPVQAGDIKADIYIVTHDHLDHLDPETIAQYRYKDSTQFVAPRFAAKKLAVLGVPKGNIHICDSGDSIELDGVIIKGVFALGTSPDVLDTTGYLISFPNGKSVYHSSDTAYCRLLLEACPHADVLLVCINGKDGNLNVQEAVEMTKAVDPLYVIPNHYDMMALNAENPEVFQYYCGEAGIEKKCVIMSVIDPFIW